MSDYMLTETLKTAFSYADTVTNRGYLSDAGMSLRDMLNDGTLARFYYHSIYVFG